jgi:hypothetical protein
VREKKHSPFISPVDIQIEIEDLVGCTRCPHGGTDSRGLLGQGVWIIDECTDDCMVQAPTFRPAS